MKSKNIKRKSTSQFIIGLSLVTISLVSVFMLSNIFTKTTAPTSVEAAGISPLGQTENWELIFSDEFEGSTLDRAKWEPSWFGHDDVSFPVNDDEDSCYDPAQVSVSNGLLNLSAVTTNNPNCKIKSGAQSQYASGLVNTRESFTFTYGYMEARMNLPGENTDIWNWPAFWSDGTGEWPKTGEIDVMEGLSSHKPCWHYHYEDQAGRHQSDGGCVDSMDGTGWHTYAAKWEPGKITYYYDGEEVGSTSEGVVNAEHFLILNYALNDRYGIHVPATAQVDYVRVWQKGSGPAPTVQPTPTPTVAPTPTPTATPAPTPTPTATAVPTPLPTVIPTPTPTPIFTIPDGVSVQSFFISPSRNIKSSERVRAQAVVRSSRPIRVQALTIAVRDSNNNNYDFTGAKNNVRITSRGYRFRPNARRFPPGNYTAFVAYKVDNRWYNLSPQISFTVTR